MCLIQFFKGGNKMDKIYYLSLPLSIRGFRTGNLFQALSIANEFKAKGIKVVIPEPGKDIESEINNRAEMFYSADGVIFLHEWEEYDECIAEYQEATHRGMPVIVL